MIHNQDLIELRNITIVIDNRNIITLANVMDTGILITDIENNVKMIGIIFVLIFIKDAGNFDIIL